MTLVLVCPSFPRKNFQHVTLRPTAFRISAANAEATKHIHTKLLRRSFSWTIVITDTVKILLGADFLSYYNLLVNCKLGILQDGDNAYEYEHHNG